MSPPRWPFLVEIDALSQLNLFFATDKQTTVPLGMRIVGRNLERDTYFIAPVGLHLLYRRLMRRYDRAQAVLQALRGAPTPALSTLRTWPPLQIPNVTILPPTPALSGTYQFVGNLSAGSAGSISYHNPCTCPTCQAVHVHSTTLTP